MPSLIISTVDKFAQIAFKDYVGQLFGNVKSYSEKEGFRRTNAKLPNININSLDPIEFILQDELHLIEGPLGSITGAYEVLIDELSKRFDSEKNLVHKIKYIASTATIRAGKEQVKSLFDREFRIFPPSGISDQDSFFMFYSDNHQIDEVTRGRLHFGICAPGKSRIEPQMRIWTELLQTGWIIYHEIVNGSFTETEKSHLIQILDNYWTVTGYFNSIRELAGIRAIYTQEFITWLKLLYGEDIRKILKENDPIELSSRTDSVVLPNYFEILEGNITKNNKNITNGVLTTSMFGTGVDVTRLGLMIINGQPKTTSSYIQASGRIGRNRGGLVAIFYAASRPRDLDHYEQFSSYHQSIYRFVEPISVAPFAPECNKRTLGPIVVSFLRQAEFISGFLNDEKWIDDYKGAKNILALQSNPINADIIRIILQILETRRANQPIGRDFDITENLKILEKKLKDWFDTIFNNIDQDLVFKEYTFNTRPTKSVVLGDPQHETFKKAHPEKIIIFNNAPNSFRGIEATTGFGPIYRKIK